MKHMLSLVYRGGLYRLYGASGGTGLYSLSDVLRRSGHEIY